MDPDAFNNLMKSMLSSTPVVEPIDSVIQQAAVKTAAAAASNATTDTATKPKSSLEALPSPMRASIPKPVAKDHQPASAQPQPSSTPAALVNIQALLVVAPAGMEARTTVRIRRARARSASSDSQPRSMFVTRVQSLLRSMPEAEEQEDEDDEEDDDMDEQPPTQMVEEGEVVTPIPAASKSKSGGRQSNSHKPVIPNPAALSSASPYPFGAPSPPPPSARPAAVSPMARRRSTAYQEDSDDDESKSASTPSAAPAAASGRPRSQRNAAPKRRHDEVDLDDVHAEQGDRDDDQGAGGEEEQGDEDEEGAGDGAGDDNSSAAGGTYENDPARCLRFNTSSRIRAISATHLNRSGCRSWNAFLKDIGYRTHDLHELRSDEFLALVPRWALEARMSNGDLYVHCTIKGYMNSLLRVVRCFQPKSEWAHLPSLSALPGMQQAIAELQARELALHKRKSGDMYNERPKSKAGAAAVSTTGEMTTRRAQRIANGEPAHRESYYSYSQSSSADNSPHYQSLGSGADIDPGFSLEPNPPVVDRRRTPLLKFTPEQEQYLMSALDPGQPEGLQRLNFISIARYFGICYTEENRTFTIRNFLRGSKWVKVKYQGGLKPKQEHVAMEANDAGTTNAVPAEAAAAPPAAASEPDAPAESAMTDAIASDAAAPAASASTVDAAAAPVAAATMATSAAATDAMDTSDLAPAQAAASSATAPSEAPPAANGDAAAAAVAPVAAEATAAASADSTAPAVAAAADSAPTAYADETTPFEIADPADESPSVCLRLVRFIVFLPSPGSKRRMGFIYERPWDGDMCPIRLYDSYLSHRPPLLSGVVPGLSSADVDASYTLWLKSKKHLAPFELEWFNCVPIGRGKLGNLIPLVCQGLQYAPGFSNGSILHTPHKINITLSDAEIEEIKLENQRCNYGVPTAAENRAAQQAAAEAAAANPQSKPEAELAPSHTGLAPAFQQPSGRQNKRQRLDANNNAAAAAPVPQQQQQQQQADTSSAYLQQLQQQQRQQQSQQYQIAAHPATSASRSSAAQAPRSFYPGPSGFIPEYLQRNDRLLQYIDHANNTQGAKFNLESPPDVAPLLLATGANSSFPVTIGVVSAIPPSFPSAPALPPLASRSTLVPSNVSSVPQLLSFLDRFEGELSTLQSMAAAAAQSLSGLRSMAQGLKAEASASIKVQQQSAKIAEQFKIIEEQKFLIEQLKAASGAAAAASATAAVSAAAPAASSASSPSASSPALAAASAAAPLSEEKRAVDDGPAPMDEDNGADELPPLIVEAAVPEEQKQDSQQAADKPVLSDSTPSGSATHFTDQKPALVA